MSPATIAAYVAAGQRTSAAIAAAYGVGPDYAAERVRVAILAGDVEAEPAAHQPGSTGKVLRLPGEPAVLWDALMLAPLVDADEAHLLVGAHMARREGSTVELTTLGRATIALAERLMAVLPGVSSPHAGSAVARAVAGDQVDREARMAIMEASGERADLLRSLTRGAYREVMTGDEGRALAAIIAPVYEDHECLARAVLDGLVHRLIAAGEL